MEKNGKVAYLLHERSSLARDTLAANGFEVIVGNGEYDEQALARCWALMPGRGRVPAELLARAPQLRIIAKEGVGVERIDVAACTRRGICVTNTPLSNFIPVAEHTFALMLSAAKHLVPLTLGLHALSAGTPLPAVGQAAELYGKTLSLIGFGHIGARVAFLANAFGMRVVTYVRHPERIELPDYVTLAASMDDAIAQADVLSLHVSGVEANRGLMGRREFSLMKPTAIFINTTRGMIVDEAALYDALSRKTIAAAGIDVFADEPIKPDNPLLTLDNLSATPHTAANTRQSRDRACLECAQAIQEFYEGKRPTSAINDYERCI